MDDKKQKNENIGEEVLEKVSKTELEDEIYFNNDDAESVEQLKSEIEVLKDSYLRTMAEFENFKKRTLKEKEQIRQNTISYTLVNLLDVFDNLERASLITSEDEKLKKGIDLTIAQYKKALDKLSVEEINPLGKTFDPSLHNAVMHIEDDSLGKNEICEVLQKGYKIGDEVIRFAMVKVAN